MNALKAVQRIPDHTGQVLVILGTKADEAANGCSCKGGGVPFKRICRGGA